METENIQFDEKLSEAVKKFPCLYNKAIKDHKDKHVVKNAWAKVAEELSLDEGKKF